MALCVTAFPRILADVVLRDRRAVAVVRDEHRHVPTYATRFRWIVPLSAPTTRMPFTLWNQRLALA